MAFTFQINNDIKFKYNQDLLNKANQYRPTINYHSVNATSLGNLNKITNSLGGYNIKKVADISELPKHSFTQDEKVILDFGDHYVGRFSMNIKKLGSPMDAPLFPKFKFAEMPVELAEDSANYKGWLSKSWIQEEYIHLDTLPTRLELPRRYSFRYLEITILGISSKWRVFFENPVVTTESSVDLSKVSVPKLADSEITKIYTVGLKTLEGCMQDVFEDGPKRDQRLWLGDLRLQALANYATFKNTDLVKRCLYLFAAMPSSDGCLPADVFTNPTEIPDDTFLFDYSLFFVSTLADFEKFSHEKAILNDLYDVAKKQVNIALKQVSKQGELKLDDTYPVFIDWSNEFDKTTAGQAIMIYTLKQFIALARLVKDPETSFYKEKLASLEKFTRRHLFDEKIGLFVSGNAREINVASQAWMVLAHVFNDQENQKLMQNTVHQLFPIKNIATPYMYHHVTQALFEANLTDEAVELMKSYWGKMVQLGADTYWEAFNPEKPEYSPYGSPLLTSYCHAWSCTPVYLIEKYLLER
ncbi:alpha-L-rhamnosidase-related protein [Pediococcus ethanolidurans]|uniref:alpha-L-rhamnosidase-related protein n=1 Tax=Pediococcus ethanolidurans TaxID=319653 RepID=UPI0021AA5AA1|nr:alpha-rhamnosidase [Pediococcus ethanolidurans]MCT4397461.1 alpha-rhamnosidase [Pediococcus ethanolidurans]MCV3554830.1 alpha-rhamnosidase [Pediococcus ethanolidurans]